jgi:hypothetical protein
MVNIFGQHGDFEVTEGLFSEHDKQDLTLSLTKGFESPERSISEANYFATIFLQFVFNKV